MKKALIALSVAAGMIGAAQAENTTTLYGSLGVQTQYSHQNGTDQDLNDASWDLSTETAKLGVKGTEDLSNGLQAFYKFEFDFTDGNGLNKTRYAYIGLSGDFGTVTLGKQDSLYKVVTNYNDIFEGNYYDDYLTTFSSLTGGSRINKVISYVSPNFSGFQFGVAGVLDGSHTVVEKGTKKSFNAAQAGLWYNANGFYAGLAYSWVDQDLNTNLVSKNPRQFSSHGSTEVIGGAFGYSNDAFKVGLGAQHASSVGEVYNLAGEYYYGPNTFRAGFGLADYKGDQNIYSYALGYQYNFSKRTYAWVEGQYVDAPSSFSADGVAQKIKIDDKPLATGNGYQVKVGLRHNF